MSQPLEGRIRSVRTDEIDRWCEAPLPPADPRLGVWRDGERAWVERWETPPSRLFVFETPDGDLLGKYDVPIVRDRGWTLWAPTVRKGPEAEAVMDALCGHQVAEARRLGVGRVELLLERGHGLYDLARAALPRAGYAFEEERVVVAVDLQKPLPETALALDVRPARDLSEAALRQLCRDAEIPDSSTEELLPSGAGLDLGVVVFEGGRPIGLALAQNPVDPEELIDHGIGVVPDARGRGVGRALVRAFLARGHEQGAKIYVASTAEDNAAMCRVFETLGAEVVGKRSVFRL